MEVPRSHYLIGYWHKKDENFKKRLQSDGANYAIPSTIPPGNENKNKKNLKSVDIYISSAYHTWLMSYLSAAYL